eukprot:scaffold160908_cov17-Tisochrysis_lutea.AAC.1
MEGRKARKLQVLEWEGLPAGALIKKEIEIALSTSGTPKPDSRESNPDPHVLSQNAIPCLPCCTRVNLLTYERRLHEAKQVVEEALGMAAMRNPRAPFRQQFVQLLERIDHALAPVSQHET